MTPYDEALARAEEKGIMFFNNHQSKDTPAVGMKCNEDMAIFINEGAFDSDRARSFAVWHEIFHCEENAFYNERTDLISAIKLEKRVIKKTIQELVPFQTVIATYKDGIFDEYEQAEKWNIPQYRIKEVHEVYERLYPDKINELKHHISENFN